MQLECPHCQASDDIDIGAGQPPERNTARIWPWFLIMLMLLTGGGFWMQKNAWLDNRWFRSLLVNVGIELPMRAKDWRIEPESVRPEWIKRNDGGRALLIHGRIDNLMRSDMPLPRLRITFFSTMEPQKKIGQRVLVIRIMPSEQHIHQAPDVLPDMDGALVSALEKHDFAVLVKTIPQQTGDFTLIPNLP